MNAHRTTIHALAGAIACAALLGCAGTQVSTDRDAREYRTFDVLPGEVVDSSGLPGEVIDSARLGRRKTLVRDRVESALEQGLQDKGLEPAAENPDLIATYTAGERDAVVTDVEDGPAFGYGPMWFDEYSESALLIELIDPKTNKVVWRSAVRMEDEDLRDPHHIGEAVDKALKTYPGVPRQPMG